MNFQARRSGKRFSHFIWKRWAYEKARIETKETRILFASSERNQFVVFGGKTERDIMLWWIIELEIRDNAPLKAADVPCDASKSPMKGNIQEVGE
jgi:hypothetical protein